MFLSELLKWGGREREREREKGGRGNMYQKNYDSTTYYFFNRRTLTITINC